MLLGVSVLLNAGARLSWAAFEVAYRVAGIAEGATLMSFLQWILTLARSNAERVASARWLRAGQAAALIYVIGAVAAPDVRTEHFIGDAVVRIWGPGFWVFGLPMVLGIAAAVAAIAHLFHQRVDRAERSRLTGLTIAAPLLAIALVVPVPAKDILVGIGVVLIAAAVLRYHALRGFESEYLRRFLAPQVAALIQERGLREGLRADCIDLTAVSCDLRGFTHYTQTHPTEYALQLLREYYKIVGKTTASFGVTLKDFVGDGALILIGAPLRIPAHANVGLAFAEALRRDVERMLARWSPRLHRLGIGIGVASGPVQVGVVASDSRYEYVAVGPAVNLASRLCESAESGQILCSPTTAARASDWHQRLQPGPLLLLKGVRGAIQAGLLPVL